MSRFEAINKSEAGRQLALIKKEIVSVSSKLNRMDLVPLLLCLEDAINNFEIMFLKSFLTDKKRKKNEELFLSVSQLVAEWYQAINESLVQISDNGCHLPPKITKLPQFSFGICIQRDIDDYLLRLYKRGELDNDDLVLRKPRLFLNRIPGWFFIAVRGCNDKIIEDSIAEILEMRDLFYKKGLLEETMLYISPDGTTVEFDDTTGMRKITLPTGATVESVLEQKGITPRLLETYTTVFDWNSYFREMAAESLKSVELGKSDRNLDRLKEEDQEIYKAYSDMKDYPETFREFYGIELEDFFNIISEITYLCYSNIHTLGWWKCFELIKEKG